MIEIALPPTPPDGLCWILQPDGSWLLAKDEDPPPYALMADMYVEEGTGE